MNGRAPIPNTARCLGRASAVVALVALAACSSGGDSAQSTSDDALETGVIAAIANASDLPPDAFSVAASDGVVRITGSVVCEDCRGMLTPGGIQSVQQTLGAVVRAVPGVESVEFDLEYQP
jgi:osmotically-inducible protein OsmY